MLHPTDADARLEVSNTIELLGHRLRRIEFYLDGSDGVHNTLQSVTPGSKDSTVHARLARMKRALGELAFKSQPVHDILSLHADYPEIFLPVSKDNANELFTESEKLATIISCATLYSTTASQLTSIKDLPVPVSEMFACLISLHPRLARIEALQNSEAQEITGLKLRTASVLQRWYEIRILAGGECWTEWEDKIVQVERSVRKEEATKLQDAITK